MGDEEEGDDLAKKRRKQKKQEKQGSGRVAEFLFEVMQGKPTEKEQLKAAELLGKHLGMFERKEKKPDTKAVEFVGDEEL